MAEKIWTNPKTFSREINKNSQGPFPFAVCYGLGSCCRVHALVLALGRAHNCLISAWPPNANSGWFPKRSHEVGWYEKGSIPYSGVRYECVGGTEEVWVPKVFCRSETKPVNFKPWSGWRAFFHALLTEQRNNWSWYHWSRDVSEARISMIASSPMLMFPKSGLCSQSMAAAASETQVLHECQTSTSNEVWAALSRGENESQECIGTELNRHEKAMGQRFSPWV